MAKLRSSAGKFIKKRPILCPKCSVNQVFTQASYCTECNRKYMAEYTKKHGRCNWTTDWKNASLEQHIGHQRSCAKQRSKKKNISFCLSTSDLVRLYHQQEGKCALSGIEMTVQFHSPWKLSLDRRDNEKGYTLDNVHWVTWAANRAKGNLTDEDLLTLCTKIIQRTNDV